MNRLVNLITLHVDAPVRKGYEYQPSESRHFENPRFMEKRFAQLCKDGGIIPDDYFDKYLAFLERIGKWIDSHIRKVQKKMDGRTEMDFLIEDEKRFFCNVFEIFITLENCNLSIESLSVRPCAEGCKFYKRTMHFIRTKMMLCPQFKWIAMNNCLKTNIEIIRRWGFTLKNIERNGERDYWIRIEKLKQSPSWEVTDPPPTAEQLNSEEFVNREILRPHDAGDDAEMTDEYDPEN